MSPSFTMSDTICLSLTNSIALRKIDVSECAAIVKASYFAHVIFGYLNHTVTLASRAAFGVKSASVSVTNVVTDKPFGVKARAATVSRCAPSLIYAINSIIFGCTKPQVRRVTARRVVAGMTNKQAIRDRAIGVFISQPMRIKHLTRYSKFSVPIFVYCALPLPAFIGARNINTFPKCIFDFLRGILMWHACPPLRARATGDCNPASGNFISINYTRFAGVLPCH